MEYKVYDKAYRSRIIDFGGEEVDFKDHQAVMSDSLAYRLSRTSYEEYIFQDKRVPFNPDSWGKEKRLIWNGNFSSANGFGMVAENTVKEMYKLGVQVYSCGGKSRAIIGGGMVDPVIEKAINRLFPVDCIEVQHCQPPAFRDEIVQRSWIYSMFETTHTPEKWIPMLNKAERIIVPSKWLVDSWHEQGVTRPIDVIGHGIDPKVYYYLDRPERETYTFLHYGQLSVRKGTDLAAKAFLDEFKGQKDVKFIFKNTFPYIPILLSELPQYPEIEFIHATYSKEEMTDLLFEADCFVFPTCGEGFGLPPFEAMATGLPTIVTPWSGTADYVNKEDTLLLDYKMTEATNFAMIYDDWYDVDESPGEWAQPSYEDLRAKMRWAYEHRKEAKEMGKKAATRLARDWTWEAKIKELYHLIDRNV